MRLRFFEVYHTWYAFIILAVDIFAKPHFLPYTVEYFHFIKLPLLSFVLLKISPKVLIFSPKSSKIYL